MDAHRESQLRRMDIGSLRACAAWGSVNAPSTAETRFACSLLTERERLELELRASSPLRKAAVDQRDAGHLPLFVAANEPGLF